MSWEDATVRPAAGIIAAVILALLGLVLVVVMINVTGLALCSDHAALKPADDCIEATSAERAIGLVAGWLAVVCAAVGIAFAIRFATRRTGAVRLVVTAALAPVLALLAVAFLPVSF
jgi:drug/metabolite transporter (DMT)-like permease